MYTTTSIQTKVKSADQTEEGSNTLKALKGHLKTQRRIIDKYEHVLKNRRSYTPQHVFSISCLFILAKISC